MSWTRGLAPPRRSPRWWMRNAPEKPHALRPGRFHAPGRRRGPAAIPAQAAAAAPRWKHDWSDGSVRGGSNVDGGTIAWRPNRAGPMDLKAPMGPMGSVGSMGPMGPTNAARADGDGATTHGSGRFDDGWFRPPSATSNSTRPRPPFAFAFGGNGVPIAVVRGICGASLARRPPRPTTRFRSKSSRSDGRDDDKNKTDPMLADGDGIGNPDDSRRSEVGSSSEPPSDGDERIIPSEPSVHDVSYLPPALRPYARLARLDKPIGTFLLLHPCLWSTALAAAPLGSLPDPGLCALLGLGSFVMRGAGCTVNDMWDAEYDRDVARTRSRPLASGELTHPQAWGFLALQLTAGLGVLTSLPHADACFGWGAASLPLVATYPLAKRWTAYPQLMLGLTFNWGAIVGWVAVRGEVDWTAVGPLYGGCVAWTLVYDTLYAHQDKEDDAKLGLKSTALTFGEERTRPILTALTVAAWGGWCLAGRNSGLGDPLEFPCYYAGISLAGSHLLWQIWTADLNDAENLAARFRSNNAVGWIVFGSCVAGNVMAG